MTKLVICPGDLVHYVTERGHHRPAMVIHVMKGDVLDLQVFFNPIDLDTNPSYRARNGFLAMIQPQQLPEQESGEPLPDENCQKGGGLTAGTWHWSAKTILERRLTHVHVLHIDALAEFKANGGDLTSGAAVCSICPGIVSPCPHMTSSGAAKPDSAQGEQSAQSGPRTTGGKKK